MTIAYVKNADGSGGLVQNTFRDSAGTLHTVSNDFTDSDGNVFTIFREQLLITPTGDSNQVFRATDARTFLATVEGA